MGGAVYRTKKKKFIFWQSFFFIFIVLMAAYVLLQSPIFNISKIIVRGNSSLTAGELIKVSGIVTGMNIFKADLQIAAEKVRVLPVVKDVSITRKLPGDVIIEVEERVSAALVVADGRFLELDTEGYYLREGSAAASGLPVITGITVQVAEPGQLVKGEGLKTALRVVRELPAGLRKELSEVHIGEDGMVTLYTLDGIQCRLGLPEDVAVKGSYFLQVQQELQDGHKSIEYVDFSFVGSPVVKYKD